MYNLITFSLFGSKEIGRLYFLGGFLPHCLVPEQRASASAVPLVLLRLGRRGVVLWVLQSLGEKDEGDSLIVGASEKKKNTLIL